MIQRNDENIENVRNTENTQAMPVDRFQRTRMLIGDEALQKLENSKVLVFGVGGVGGYVCEALARAGVGKIDIVDKDVVDITNINRQIIATTNTIGMDKVDVCRDRMQSINPNLECEARKRFYLPETAEEFDFEKYDYIVDAVDNVTAKIDIICRAKLAETPVISCMGTGNKLDPTAFHIADIEKTKVCPLAKVVRKELRNRGVKGVKVLYSEEEPAKTGIRTPASISFVPSVAGLIIAGEVIKDLIKQI